MNLTLTMTLAIKLSINLSFNMSMLISIIKTLTSVVTPKVQTPQTQKTPAWAFARAGAFVGLALECLA